MRKTKKMPAPLLIPGIIAGTELLSNGFNAISQSRVNRQSREWQEKMYGRQRQDALLDWNAQNAYNTPAAQMARFKEAGLNPHLIYGNGTDATAGAVRSSNAGSYSPSAPQINLDARNPLMSIYDIEMKEAQIDNLHAQNAVLQEEAILKQTQQASLLKGQEMSSFDLQFKADSRSTDLEQRKANLTRTNTLTQTALDENERRKLLSAQTLEKGVEEIKNLRQANAESKARVNAINAGWDNLKKDGILKQYEILLREKGANQSDNFIIRAISRILDRYGITTKSLPDIGN